MPDLTQSVSFAPQQMTGATVEQTGRTRLRWGSRRVRLSLEWKFDMHQAAVSLHLRN